MQSFTSSADYQKRSLKTIVTHRVDAKAPIESLTQDFTIPRPQLSPEKKGSEKPSTATRTVGDVLRSIRYKTTSLVGYTFVNPKHLQDPHPKLQYPKPKTAQNLSSIDLDQYIIKAGKAVRPDPINALQTEISDSLYQKYQTRTQRNYLNFEELASLDRTSNRLRRKLAKITAGSPSRSLSIPASFSSPRLQMKEKHRVSKSSRTGTCDVLRFNKTALYNLTSENPVPKEDLEWKRKILKSPYTYDTSKWARSNPVLLNNTVASSMLKTRFLIQEKVDESTANVYVRYPYCRECIKSAVPIKIQLDRTIN